MSVFLGEVENASPILDLTDRKQLTLDTIHRITDIAEISLVLLFVFFLIYFIWVMHRCISRIL